MSLERGIALVLLLILIGLVLVGCDKGEPDHVTITPTLACTEAVHCKIHQWSVGLPRHVGGAQFEGTYIRCRCYKNGEEQ